MVDSDQVAQTGRILSCWYSIFYGSILYVTKGTPEVTALKITMDPGAKTGWHYHPVTALGYVLSEELQVEMDTGEKHHWKQGYLIPVNSIIFSISRYSSMASAIRLMPSSRI